MINSPQTVTGPMHRRLETCMPFLIPVALGLIAAGVGILASALDLKFAVAIVGGCAAGTVALCMRTIESLTRLLIIGLALSVPVNLDITFAHLRHMGGAPGYQVSASMLIAGSLWALWLYQWANRQWTPFIRANSFQVSAVLMYMMAGVLSLVNALYPNLVFMELHRIAMLLMIMLTVMNLRSIEHVRLFMSCLAIGVVIQAGLATAQHLTGESLGLEIFGGTDPLGQDLGYVFSRPTGTAGHPNGLSYLFEMMIPLMLALSLAPQSLSAKVLYALAFVSAVGGIILTLSRGAWITVPFSVGIVFFLVMVRQLVNPRLLMALFLIGLGVAAAAYKAGPIVYKRLTHDDYRSAESRLPQNIAAFSIIEQFPVLGVGLNNYSWVYKKFDKTTFSRTLKGVSRKGQQVVKVPYRRVVHNIYLWTWAEVGTVGLLAFLAIFATTFGVAWRSFLRGSQWGRAYQVGAVAGLLAHLAHANIDPGFRVPLSTSTLVFCLMGLIGAVARIDARPLLRDTPGHGSEAREALGAGSEVARAAP